MSSNSDSISCTQVRNFFELQSILYVKNRSNDTYLVELLYKLNGIIFILGLEPAFNRTNIDGTDVIWLCAHFQFPAGCQYSPVEQVLM